MSEIVIRWDELVSEVTKALEEYSHDTNKALKEEVAQMAKACAKDLKSASRSAFNGTGEYAKGWSAKKVFESVDDVRYEVYNTKKPTLTHLLEYGHRVWYMGHDTGRYAPGRAHIRPVADKVEEQLYKNVKLKLG